MQTKDYLLVAFAPFALLWIPLVGMQVSADWQWTSSDFVLMWALLAGTTFTYRLFATRRGANLAYRAGAGLAVATGCLLIWVNLAVQIIGDGNPGNTLYFAAILLALAGVGVSRFQAAALARVAFGLAAAVLVIPVIAVLTWPADFSPGFPQVCALNAVFVALFAGAGLLFRHAARTAGESQAA